MLEGKKISPSTISHLIRGAMMRFLMAKIIFLVFFIGSILSPLIVNAGQVHIVVKSIIASQERGRVDPRLSHMTRKFSSVFRYNSYRLLNAKALQLGFKERGVVSITSDLRVEVTPIRKGRKRIELKLVIKRGRKRIFNSTVAIINRGSVIVGGPRYKKGNIILNISASF